MNNPWLDFNISDHMVHPLDEDSVAYHNRTSKAEHQFLTYLPPEPWIGNLNASLVVLYSNPGATINNTKRVFQTGHDLVVEKSIQNLKQTLKNFPHFHFDPALANTEGATWFLQRYRWLIEQVGISAVSKNLLTCELAPYHSLKWKEPKRPIYTQSFTNHLIRSAMDRRALILVARSKRIWFNHIPELEKYPRTIYPNSINASVSPGNYPRDFESIVAAVSR